MRTVVLIVIDVLLLVNLLMICSRCVRRNYIEHFARLSDITKSVPGYNDPEYIRNLVESEYPHAPRQTDLAGTSACYMRVGPDGPCCYGSLGKSSVLYNFCSGCYVNDPDDPTNVFKRRPSFKCFGDPSDTLNHPGYRTCRGCMMVSPKRMGCWCLEGSSYPNFTNAPWTSAWVEMDVSKPPNCSDAKKYGPGLHLSFTNDAGNAMKMGCVPDTGLKMFGEIAKSVLTGRAKPITHLPVLDTAIYMGKNLTKKQ